MDTSWDFALRKTKSAFGFVNLRAPIVETELFEDQSPHVHDFVVNGNQQKNPLLNNDQLEDEQQPVRTQIRQLIAPFLAVLRWGGLYFDLRFGYIARDCDFPPKTTTNNTHGNIVDTVTFCTQRRRPSFFEKLATAFMPGFEAIGLVLSYFSLIVTVIDISRLIYTFYAQLISSDEPMRLALITDNLETIKWALQCIIIHVILMAVCHQHRFNHLFSTWENIRIRYPDSASTEKEYDFSRRFRRKQSTLVVVGIGVLALNCFCLFGPLFIPAEVYEPFKIYVMNPFDPDNVTVKTLIVVAMIFRSFDYVFSATLFLLISDALVLQFTQYFKDFSTQISDEGILQCPHRLEWHRLKHIRLCGLVQRVDAIFSPYILIGLLSGITGVLAQVFVIYDFLKGGDMGVVTVMSYVYWSLLNLLQVLLILWSGSRVNVAALLPLDKLYEIDQRTLTIQESHHVTIFVQKLTGSQTGYTALGIFTIDMTTILSLAGFYFTYQFLLFQMQNDSWLTTQMAKMQDVTIGLRIFPNVTL